MSVTMPDGFRAAAMKAGIKPSGKPDLVLIVRDEPASGAHPGASAMCFTSNNLVGAPVIIGRRVRAEVIAGRLAPLRAMLINAGNSNAATGEQGVADARACCAAAAKLIGCDESRVLPSSTGVIGRLLPTKKITDALPALHAALARGERADTDAAEAIMTTDRVPKRASREVRIGSGVVRIGAIAKGAGMIAPALDSLRGPTTPSATMLAFITTDAPIDSPTLQHALEAAVGESFNRVSVDNHASCSDTVVCVSSGAAKGIEPIRAGSPAFTAFAGALRTLCVELSTQIVADGEGATRTFTVAVSGAAADAEAARIAREVVNSPLVKCAVHGGDPNWGRIVTAAGNAGVRFDPARCSLTIGAVKVFDQGRPVTAALNDPGLKPAMTGASVQFDLRVGDGPGSWWMTGCDLTSEYVRINADYTT